MNDGKNRIIVTGAMIAIIWTVLVLTSTIWNVKIQSDQVRNNALVQARATWEKDILYRRWNAFHGGVYVSVSDSTLPNEYLETPFRDIDNPAGGMLTKINPAYMTRQVFELGEREYGIFQHITSLKPIRPGNKADDWERAALMRFEAGEQEVDSIMQFHGEEYLRFMRPLITESSCLKCHAIQGYKEGDIRGGISVAIPMGPLIENSHIPVRSIIFTHTFLWLIGLLGIIYVTIKLNFSFTQRMKIIVQQQVLIDDLKKAVSQIKTLSGFIPICSNCKKIRNDEGYWNQVENYIMEHSDASFTHGICPDCMSRLYPEYSDLEENTDT